MNDTLIAGQPIWPLVYLGAIAFIAALARGFSGFGGALIFVPLASAVFGPQVAAPILMLVDGVLQLSLMKNAWQLARRGEAGIMALGALAGIPLGVLALKHLDPVVLRWGISGLTVAMLALLVSGWRYHGAPKPPITIGVGFVSGLLSGAIQAGGPPVVAYWLGGGNTAATMRANIILFFFCTSLASGITYLVAGLLDSGVLLLTLVAAPGYALGLYFGTRMFNLASERSFRRACYLLIAAAALVSLPALDSVLR
ncbi:MAG: sulfite exporter TauE/SafE family protein [Rhodospirillaceae bacterium]|nr:sulfite exporter TauE/SafE family protein [Rhodospirillaceae bacterium]